MNPIVFQTTDWSEMPLVVKPGVTGTASYRTLQFHEFRVRLVEYSAGYKADHWCKAGHIVFCLDGEMTTELSDGRTFQLTKGMSYTVSDNISSHRSYSENGVKLMIIDGSFLKEQKKAVNPWKM